MTITELAPSTGWPTIPVLKNRLLTTRPQVLKQIKSELKKIKKLTTAYTRRQYFLTDSYRDIRRAIRLNEDIFIASIATFVFLAYSITVMTSEFLIALFSTLYAMSEATGVNVLIVVMIMGAFLLVVSSLIAAFSVNFVSIALMDGANHKIYRSIRSTSRRSLNLASRTLLAWLLYGVFIMSRLAVVGLIGYAYIKWMMDYMALSPQVLVIVAAISGVWVLVGILRYSLVPIVALFETDLLIFESFGRSRRLTHKGSKSFLAFGTILLGGYFAGLYVLCKYLNQWLGPLSTLLFALGVLAGIIAINGSLTMLYRKRKCARLV